MRIHHIMLLAMLAAGCAENPSTAPSDAKGGSGPQLGGGSGCNITTWQGMSDPLNVTANSSGNDAQWFIKNNGSSPVTVNSESGSLDGTVVTASSSTGWIPLPGTLQGGQQLDADWLYTVAGPGTGSIGLSVSTSCGVVNFPTYTVNAN